ncbi:MAG: S8 family serine peptidase, partial [Patescibacteria group bacterium]
MNKKTLIRLLWIGSLIAVAALVYFLVPRFKADVSMMAINESKASFMTAAGFDKIDDGKLVMLSGIDNPTNLGDNKISGINGNEITIGSGGTTIFPSPKNMVTYIDKKLAVRLVDTNNNQANEAQKISSSVSSLAENGEDVRVIIKLKEDKTSYASTNSVAENKTAIDQTKTTATQIDSLIGGDGDVTKNLSIVNSVAATVNQKALEKIQADSRVESVIEDAKISSSLDTSVGQIQADKTWGVVTDGTQITGKGMRIAIIDTGVDYSHADLGGCLGANCKVIGGYDFVSNDNDPMDDQGHGTHVAATAAGKGLLNGVAPDASIIAYKVLDQNGSGYSSAVIQAIERSADPNGDGDTSDHVDVASMSLGGPGGATDPSSLAVDKVS